MMKSNSSANKEHAATYLLAVHEDNMIKNGITRIKRIIRPLCDLSHSFSQEGEDGILCAFFAERTSPGFYIDVGAHHPARFSNTFRFYKMGWRGLNIDPLPGAMKLFEKFRPRDINLELAIAADSKVLKYYMFNEPALNTFDAMLAKERNGLKQNKLIKTRNVRSRPLREVMEEYLAEVPSIEFLSIDVEGFELEVLKSNDWSRYRPEVVLAEAVSAGNVEQAIISPVSIYLQSVGYELFAKTMITLIFRRCS